MPSRRQRESGEERLIARYFRPIAKAPGALALRDDAAVWSARGDSDLVLKTDAIVGGVHFFPDDPAEDVARKALRVNLSDLAAKGARPIGFLLALALPASVKPAWLGGFARGLRRDAAKYRCPLFGGDTDSTPGPITISIAAFGEVPRKQMVRRDRARAGDTIYVSGTIGDAALGLLLRNKPRSRALAKLGKGERRYLLDRYLLPRPRLALAGAVRNYANASIDVSDGLAGDLAKLAAASRLGATLEAARVPLSRAARKALAAESRLIETVLTGGDDFEIVGAVPARKRAAFERAAALAGVRVTAIGRMRRGRGIDIIGTDDKPLRLRRLSFSHF
jgi:thiamine-monophosphate kinase